MIAVYYPYWHTGSKWDELRYSLRSLEQHLQEPFIVYLVGDKPDWVQRVVHIPYERQDIGPDSAVYNALSMLKLFLEHPDIDSKEFIRMYDDIYLLRGLRLDDLRVTRVVRKADEVRSMQGGGSVWRQQIFRTIDSLRAKFPTKPGYMTETHCPELFQQQKMLSLFRIFDLPESKLLTSTLYFNLFPYKCAMVDRKTERALFYGAETDYSFSSEDIEKKLIGKRFLNHNDLGLNEDLKRFIRIRFNKKSRFEK